MAQSGSLDSLSLTAISSIALMILSQVADTSYYTYHLPPAIRQVNSSQADDVMFFQILKEMEMNFPLIL